MMYNILYIPKLGINILSTDKLNNIVMFNNNYRNIKIIKYRKK